MRYWGKHIEIDASYYNTPHGKLMSPNAAERAQLIASGGIHQLEGNVEVFEITVQNMLREIEANPVGNVLVNGIHRSPRSVRIIPLTWKEQTQLKRGVCANIIGPLTSRGNDSVIWFDPWTLWPNLTNGGTSPYQVLVHELVHSYRDAVGKALPVGPPQRNPTSAFPNIEEFFAVMLENMYVSADNKGHLMRSSYTGGTPTGAPSDVIWYKRYINEIDLWCDDHKDATAQLERVSTNWNPIRVRWAVRNNLMRI